MLNKDQALVMASEMIQWKEVNQELVKDDPALKMALELIEQRQTNQALQILNQGIHVIYLVVNEGRRYLGQLSHFSQVQQVILVIVQSSMSLLETDASSALLLLLGCDQMMKGLTPKQQAYLRLQIQNGMGCYYRRVGQLERALRELEVALALIRKYSLKEIAVTHLNLSVVLSLVEDHDGALENAKKAVLESHKQYEYFIKNHVSMSQFKFQRCVSAMAIAFYNIGVQEQHFQRYQLALQAYASGFKVAEENLGAHHYLTIQLKSIYEEFARQLAIAEAQKLSVKTLTHKFFIKDGQLRPQSAISTKKRTQPTVITDRESIEKQLIRPTSAVSVRSKINFSGKASTEKRRESFTSRKVKLVPDNNLVAQSQNLQENINLLMQKAEAEREELRKIQEEKNKELKQLEQIRELSKQIKLDQFKIQIDEIKTSRGQERNSNSQRLVESDPQLLNEESDPYPLFEHKSKNSSVSNKSVRQSTIKNYNQSDDMDNQVDIILGSFKSQQFDDPRVQEIIETQSQTQMKKQMNYSESSLKRRQESFTIRKNILSDKSQDSYFKAEGDNQKNNIDQDKNPSQNIQLERKQTTSIHSIHSVKSEKSAQSNQSQTKQTSQNKNYRNAQSIQVNEFIGQRKVVVREMTLIMKQPISENEQIRAQSDQLISKSQKKISQLDQARFNSEIRQEDDEDDEKQYNQEQFDKLDEPDQIKMDNILKDLKDPSQRSIQSSNLVQVQLNQIQELISDRVEEVEVPDINEHQEDNKIQETIQEVSPQEQDNNPKEDICTDLVNDNQRVIINESLEQQNHKQPLQITYPEQQLNNQEVPQSFQQLLDNENIESQFNNFQINHQIVDDQDNQALEEELKDQMSQDQQRSQTKLALLLDLDSSRANQLTEQAEKSLDKDKQNISIDQNSLISESDHHSEEIYSQSLSNSPTEQKELGESIKSDEPKIEEPIVEEQVQEEQKEEVQEKKEKEVPNLMQDDEQEIRDLEFEKIGYIQGLNKDTALKIQVEIYFEQTKQLFYGKYNESQSQIFKTEDVEGTVGDPQLYLKAVLFTLGNKQFLRVYSKEHEKAVLRLQQKFKSDHYRRFYKFKISKMNINGVLYVGVKKQIIYLAVFTPQTQKRNSYTFQNENYRSFVNKLQFRIINNLKYSEEKGIYLLQEPELRILAQNLQAKILELEKSVYKFKFQGFGLLNAIYDVVHQKIIIASDNRKVEAAQVDAPKGFTNEQLISHAQMLLERSYIIQSEHEQCVVYYEQKDEEMVKYLQLKLLTYQTIRKVSVNFLTAQDGAIQQQLVAVELQQKLNCIYALKSNGELFILGKFNKDQKKKLIWNLKRVISLYGQVSNNKMNFNIEDIKAFIINGDCKKLMRMDAKDFISYVKSNYGEEARIVSNINERVASRQSELEPIISQQSDNPDQLYYSRIQS